jgi:hypothetical protein
VSEEAFAGLFAQVLLIAAGAGLTRFGRIAIDGTKIPANASIDANRGRDWFDQQAKEIAAEIVEEAQRVDAAEDALAACGAGDGGDRVRGALAGRSARAGAPPVPTEEHSRIIRARRVVAAAEAADHVIAAVNVNQQPNDMPSFVPMMTAATDAAAGLHASTGSPEHQIGVVLADAGYCSNRNLNAPGPDRIIALGKGREQHAEADRSPASGPPPAGANAREVMAHRLRTPEGQQHNKRRGATVEPSIGTLKTILSRFSRRGLDAARSELDLAAAAYNIRKIHTATG